MTRHTHLVCTLWLLCLGTAAAETYRWTDAAGRVHYGDRPPADTAATVLDHSAARKADQRARTLYDPEQALQQFLEENSVRRFEAVENAKTAQAERRTAQQRQRACSQLRADLDTLHNRRIRVYLDHDGEQKKTLTPPEREALIARYQDAVTRYGCR